MHLLINFSAVILLLLFLWMHGSNDSLMQQIAVENNLAETVFLSVCQCKMVIHIRWFTPELEIDLCGHATLGKLHLYCLSFWATIKDTITFYSLSGPLKVHRDGAIHSSRLPFLETGKGCHIYPDELINGLGMTNHLGIYKNRDYVVELENEDACIGDKT